MRIRNVAIAMVWLGMAVASTAFVSNPKFARLPQQQASFQRFGSSVGTFTGNHCSDLVEEEQNGNVPSHSGLWSRAKNTSRALWKNKRSSLPWVCVVMITLCSRLMGGISPVGMDLVPTNTENMAYATVSASLLRTSPSMSSPRKLIGLQAVLCTLLIGYQILSTTGPLLRFLQSSLASFTAWYMMCLSAFPMITKALTGGLIGIAGDTGAQLLEERIRAKNTGDRFQWTKLDRRRGVTKFADSVLISGPLMHLSYNYLESLFPVAGAASGLSASMAAMTQVFIDDFFLDAIFVAIMFVTTAVGEGCANMIVPQLKKDYAGAVKTSWTTSMLLMPLEFACFRFLPIHFRVMGMNVIDIIWEGMISFMVHRRRKQQHGVVAAATAEETLVFPSEYELIPSTSY